jgi:hypothetical protein
MQMTDHALMPADISMALAHDGLRFAMASAPVLESFREMIAKVRTSA